MNEFTVTLSQARVALDGLGISEIPEETGRAALFGMLLATVESAVRDCDRGGLPQIADGYYATVLKLADEDIGDAAQRWYALVHDRLVRTTVELSQVVEAAGVDGAHIEVAASALLAACSMTALGAVTEADPVRARQCVDFAEAELKAAQEALRIL
jgi:hypothetical protein